MDQKIREKMIKCLELTASDADGEALNAIRMANKQREKLGLSWAQVIDGSGASNSRGGSRPGAGSYDYYNTDPFSEGMRRAHQRAQESERQRREQESQQRAWQQQAWQQQQERARRQEQANNQRRNSRASAAADDFGSSYKKPNEKTFKDWDDVWGV